MVERLVDLFWHAIVMHGFVLALSSSLPIVPTIPLGGFCDTTGLHGPSIRFKNLITALIFWIDEGCVEWSTQECLYQFRSLLAGKGKA